MNTKPLSVAWLIFLILLVAWLGYRFSLGGIIDANLLSLLPRSEADLAVSNTVSRVQKRFERQMVWLVGAPSDDVAKQAALDVFDRLERSGRFETLKVRHDEATPKTVSAFYYPVRFNFLGNDARDRLMQEDHTAFERFVLSRYFAPQTMISSALIERDPLLLLTGFFEERVGKASERFTISDGLLTVRDGDMTYVFISGVLSGAPFSLALQQATVPILEQIRADLPAQYPGAQFLMAGVLPHAAAGTATAIDEISTVGVGSILGIIVILYSIFRSSRPLLLGLTSITAGIVGGFSACLIFFGDVHLLTLVFGSSLVGVSIDYSLHYFCVRFQSFDTWRPDAALRHIFPGISLGLLTSVIGFAGLLIAPFDGMRQMAVFSVVGLCFAYICVVLWYPRLSRGLASPTSTAPLNWARAYTDIWRRKWGYRGWIPILGLAGLWAAGCFQLEARDDIRLLQTLDPEVFAEELRTRELIGRNLSSQFFLIEGRDEDDYLAREERLTAVLRKLQNEKRLDGYLAISDFVPSQGRQQENRSLIRTVIDGSESTLSRVVEKVGLSHTVMEDYRNAFKEAALEKPVQLSQWLSDPVSTPYRHLWIGDGALGVSGIVGLKGVFDLAALRQLADLDPKVHFFDPAGDISDLFSKYRHQTVLLTILSYGVVLAVLIFRYGLRGGIAVLMAPTIAAFASFGTLGLFGESISLFNIMALLLVLGVGVDYALFFRETGGKHPSTLLAIALSSITTLLAFGLLAFSATTAIHAFGATIMVGILVAFLLAPMARLGQETDEST